jgi:hypothetical protein
MPSIATHHSKETDMKERKQQATRRARAARASVARAFRAMAHGAAKRAAWAATVAYYRSGLREWTKQLG